MALRELEVSGDWGQEVGRYFTVYRDGVSFLFVDQGGHFTQ